MSGSPDEAPGGAPGGAPSAGRRRRSDRPFWFLVGSFVALGLLVATIGNELAVQNWDPQYARNIVERTEAFGGTFYENGIFNKGVLEPLFHLAAARITSYAGYWYAISFFAAGISLLLAAAAARTTRSFGGSRELSFVVGVVVFVHFTFSDVDYAASLYTRNITVGMLAATWLLLVGDRFRSTRRKRAAWSAVVGLLAGLVVHALPTTAFSAGVVVLAAYTLLWQQADRAERIRLAAIICGAGMAALLAPIVWYGLRGALGEFWAGWWTHATYMNRGTGRSLGSQAGLAWDQLFAYYRVRPLAFGLILAFAITTIAKWRSSKRDQRVLHLALLAWWAASWVELMVSQRYSSHYFSISSWPVALMGAVLAGHAWRLVVPAGARFRSALAWPVAALVVASYLSGPSYLTGAIREVVDFRGVAHHAADEERFYSGSSRAVLAVLDLVSDAGDPLLGWTNDPWPYLKWQRVSATRFIWKSFLMGEVYLGETGPEYVLPDTWDWFEEDLEKSRPVALVEVNSTVAPGTPFESYVAPRFQPVYRAKQMTLSIRNDVAPQLLDVAADRTWTAPAVPGDLSGWEIAGSRAWFSDGGLARQMDGLQLVADSCVRLEGRVGSGDTDLGYVTFRFVDNTGETERLHLTLLRDRVVAGSDFVVYEEILTDIGESESIPFMLVIGSRSAALVTNGRVRGAVRLPESVSVYAEPLSGSVVIRDLAIGDPPAGSGCD